MNSSTVPYYPSLYVEYISILLFCKNDFIDLLENSLLLPTHIFFGLRLDYFKKFFQRNKTCIFTENINNT